MSVSLATIGVLLMLLPGVGFIVGVNFADKNVREIVFRNTPAEFGYVLVVSIVVHLLFAVVFADFNAATMVARYAAVTQKEKAGNLIAPEARQALIYSLSYFFATAVVGLVPGALLGSLVRPLRLWAFVKHRWMLDLVGMRKGKAVFARLLLSPNFPGGHDKLNSAIVVEGILYDAFFQADGTLIYLVFTQYTEATVPLNVPPFLGALLAEWPIDETESGDRLVIEGKWVSMARYYRVDAEGVRNDSDLKKIRKSLSDEGMDPDDV